MEEKISELKLQFTELRERFKQQSEKLDEIDIKLKDSNSLILAINELAIEVRYMREDLNKVVTRVDKLENKDDEKWDKFKWAIVVCLIGIISGYLATNLGLK